MITLSSPGYSMLQAFKSNAAKIFHVIPDDTDDMSEVIEKVAKKIKAEIKLIGKIIISILTKISVPNSKQHP